VGADQPADQLAVGGDLAERRVEARASYTDSPVNASRWLGPMTTTVS